MSSIKDGVDPSIQSQQTQQVPRDASTAPNIVISHTSSQSNAQSNDVENGSNGHASHEDQGELQVPIVVQVSHSESAPPQSDPASSLGKPTEGSSTNVPPSEKKSPSLSAPAQPSSSRKKRSFWSRLFSALVPCVTHTQSHSPENVSSVSPNVPAVPEKQRPAVASTPLEGSNEKPIPKASPPDLMQDNTTQLPEPAVVLNFQSQEDTNGGGTSKPITSHAIPVDPSIDDTIVIQPPPPSPKRLSKDITGGVTSGAVQAPGSTGNEEREHVDGDSEQSESSSFTDDPDREILSPQPHAADEDYEDEEDRLIMNGGAGIPVGPVRV